MITVGKRKLLAKSCLVCGVLKQAKDFAPIAKEYYNSYCNPCRNNHCRPTMRRHQERAGNVAVRHRQPWTDQDIERLEQMAVKGLTGPQMALALNRTLYSVYTMKNKLKEK